MIQSRSLFAAALLLCVIPLPASAQYMYLDANGDGVWTSADSLRVPGKTVLDVWLRTDQNRDGSAVVCAAGGSPPLAYSYEFNLLATGGTISWGTYTNNISGFDKLASASDTANFYMAYTGSAVLSPGLYKLGSVEMFITSGRPTLTINPANLAIPAWTQFALTCGTGQSVSMFQLASDWFDTDGLAAASDYVAFTEVFDYPNGTVNPPWADTGNPWKSTGFPSWGFTSSNSSCDYWLGTHSATAAGPSYCATYPAGANNALLFDTGINVSRLATYHLSFVERHNLMLDPQFLTDDYLYYLIEAGSLADPGTMSAQSGGGSLTGGTTEWRRQYTLDVDNSGSSPQHNFASPVFGLVGDQVTGSGTYGAWIDSVQILGTQRPDLVVSGSVTASGSSSSSMPLVAGQPWYLKFKVKNLGGTISSAFRMKVYLDNSTTELTSLDESGIGVGDSTSVNWLLDGSAINGGPQSPHSVKIKLDTENTVYESDPTQTPEINNTYPCTGCPALQFTWIAPDLSVQSPLLVSPAIPKMGQTVQVTVTVRNGGTQAITTPFGVAWYRSRSSMPNQTQPYDSLITVSSLAANTSVNLVFNDTRTQARTDSMYVFADRNNVISNEISETNNILGPVLVTWVPKTIVVTGKFLYSDSLVVNDSTYACTDVALYEVDPTRTDLVADAGVWPDGHFTLGPIANEDLNDDHGFLDLYVSVQARSNEDCWNASYPDNWYLKIWNVQTDSIWSCDSQTYQNANPASDTLYVGVLRPTDYGRRAAFHMLRALTDWGWSWIRPRVPIATPIHTVRVYWAPGLDLGVTGYQTNSLAAPDSAIYVNGSLDSTKLYPDEYDDSVLLHEYGHHVASIFGFDTTTVSQSHPLSAPLPLVAAWEEGWADFFSGWKAGNPYAPHFGEYVDYGRGPGGTLTELEANLEQDSVYSRSPNLNTINKQYCTAGSGSTFELEVAGALWDIFDDHVDTPVGQVYPDSLADGFDPIWNALLGTSNRASINSVNAFEAVYESTAAVRDKDYPRYAHARWVFIQHGIGGAITGVAGTQALRPGVRLLEARPNPFNPETKLRFAVFGASTAVPVTVRIFDVSGRLVRTVFQKRIGSGTYDVAWNGESGARMPVSSGVYFCEIECQGAVRRTKLVLVR